MRPIGRFYERDADRMKRDINPWFIAVTVTLATFMELLDTAVANVSLPHIGGGLAPVEQAILVDTFPAAKRPAAFALYSMAIVTAPAVGPPLGGWITDSFSWRWVFFINIPIGIVSLILTSRLVSDPPEFKQEVDEARRAGKLRIDYVGILFVAIGFAW